MKQYTNEDSKENIYSGLHQIYQNDEFKLKTSNKNINIMTDTNEMQQHPIAPFMIIKEKFFNEEVKEAQKQMMGGGFSILGKSTKLCPRIEKSQKKCNRKSFMMINSKSAQSRPGSAFIHNENRFNRFNKPYDTVSKYTKTSQINKSDNALPKKVFQQINLITDPSCIENSITNAENHRIRTKETCPRPTSAHTCVRNIPTKNSKYSTSIYTRSSMYYRRPISAAVNIQLVKQNDCSRTINPERTKMRYLKYLRELECNAEKYVGNEKI